AADDAAGVAIASRLTSEINGTNQAIRNAMDGQAMIDTAEGAHQEVESILQRMRELAVQASNDSNSDADRTALQSEVTALVAEIDRIANVSTWAGKGLIDQGRSFTFNVGSHGGGHNEIVATTTAMTGAALGVSAGNATAGVNGATLKEVGENVLQLGGTPVAGDVYNFTINGEAMSVEIDAVNGNAFDYKLNGAAAAAVSTATGQTLGDVAIAVKAAIDAKATNHPGLTTAANTDGSVTLTQGVVVTGGYDLDTQSTATNPTVNWAQPSADYAAVTNATTGATGETWAKEDTLEIVLTSTGTTAVTAETFEVKINGTSIVAETAISAVVSAGYGSGMEGVANYLADKFSLAANTKGFNIEVGFDGTNADKKVLLKVGQSASSLITAEAATAGTSTSALLINTQSDASGAIATIDAAIVKVNAQRANLGAVSNRLDSTVNNLTSISSNLAAGRGRIEDADFAAETTSLAKSQILQQASTAMLAQANASKQNVLSLLQG
ncbi:flagellin, partial [Paracoccaceae bacterium]|nr:flagellin [Paracoccaceae bacterium]